MKQIKCRACEGRGFFMVPDMTAPDAILSAVALEFGVSVERLQGPNRAAQLCRARFQAARLMRDAGYSLKEIGLNLGGRDHSTIHHAIQRARSVEV